jgi:hypothetical protein
LLTDHWSLITVFLVINGTNMKSQIIFFILVSTFILRAQLQPAGLQGMNVYSLAQYSETIYAGTDSGVYISTPALNYWSLLAFKGKKIKSVYPHQYGPIGMAITVSVLRDSISSTEPLMYCTCDQNEWTPQDSGIVRNEITYIKDLDGFPSPVICGETFAGGFGKLYKRNFNANLWEKVFDIGMGQLNVVKANQQTGEIWIGGETAIFAPYISRTKDKGKTWSTTYPDLNGDNACNSILLDLLDTNTVYAGMEGAVIKTTDKGETWKLTGLNNTPYYFNTLAKEYSKNKLFAGGATNTNVMGLYESTDEGETWQKILPLLITPVELKGISSMLVVGNNGCCGINLYIGTLGDGIYTYHIGLPDDVKEEKQIDRQFYLYQNYPNPFNSNTVISYQLSVNSNVKLKIFDILGEEIATLVNERQNQGFHSPFFTLNSSLSSGIYIYQLQTDTYVQRKKMVVLK